MEKIFLLLAFLLSNLLLAQENFDQEMKQALQLWEEGKNKQASALFEEIAVAEEDSWLPNYYVAMINTTSAFGTKDGEEMEGLLATAQTALDKGFKKQPENPELLVIQALILTARIAYDPMTNGEKLWGAVMELYQKAETIAPNNPRVVFSKAKFEMGSARFFGTDTSPICTRIEESIILFDNFNADSLFHPKWGKEEAEEIIKTCGKA